MSSYNLVLVILLCLLTFNALLTPGAALMRPTQNHTEETATATIEEATNKLLSSFEEVQRADKAGAKVGRLVDYLNEAENHLGLANAAKEKGQYATAVAEAEQTIEIAERVEQEAKNLRKKAEEVRLLQWVLIPIAIAGIAAAAVFTWRWLKPRLEYRERKKFLEQRIEYEKRK